MWEYLFSNSHFLCQLELSGVEPVQETDCDADSEFLMEIMEINEKLAEAKNEDNLQEIEMLIKGRSWFEEFVQNKYAESCVVQESESF